ncbi:MAG: type IV pilus modification PilV family protein [Gemmatimonadales bacterium]
MPRGERGVMLLEALVALLILSVAGVALVEMTAAALRADREAARVEHTVAQADRVLAAASLLRREELDQRLGSHPVGEFLVLIQRPERSLYRIAVAEGAAPELELLATVVYRREMKP